MKSLICLALILVLHPGIAYAQVQPQELSPGDKERARTQNKLGWEDMQSERWERAAKSFQNAIDIDPLFEVPHYGLGRARMALKNFRGAIEAYVRCRDLYLAQAGKVFSTAQEAQRYRQDRLTEIDEQIRQVQSGPQTPQRLDLLRQMQNVRRDVQESMQRGNNMSIGSTVPAWVSLALGSAYFRSGQLADAEREYKAAIASDPRAGEAHSNLAVVYFETNRITEAEASVKEAKKSGFKVNPQLEQAIKEKKSTRP
jgi:tetratricopeptide (TPR) repeat protein